MARQRKTVNGRKDSNGANLGFEGKMMGLVGTLEKQFAESDKLQERIRKDLAGLGVPAEGWR